MKKHLHIFLTSLLIFGLVACGKKTKQENGYTVFKGKCLNDKYEIAYDSTINLSREIDSIIQLEIQLLGNDQTTSITHHFNNNINFKDSLGLKREMQTLHAFDSISQILLVATNGKYNPGLGALEKYWMEVYKNNDKVDWNSIYTDSLKNLNFGTKIEFENGQANKPDPRMSVWIDECLLGIVADKVADRLEKIYKIKNFYVNLGGEIRVKGNNGNDSYWPIKIEKPMINALKKIEFASIPLKNYALSTKDNFNKLHFIKGKRYSLTLDAQIGFPAKNELLSVTVMAPNALEASSYASACMSVGLENAQKILSKQPHLKAFIIYEKEGMLEHWATKNFSYTLNTKE